MPRHAHGRWALMQGWGVDVSYVYIKRTKYSLYVRSKSKCRQKNSVKRSISIRTSMRASQKTNMGCSTWILASTFSSSAKTYTVSNGLDFRCYIPLPPSRFHDYVHFWMPLKHLPCTLFHKIPNICTLKIQNLTISGRLRYQGDFRVNITVMSECSPHVLPYLI